MPALLRRFHIVEKYFIDIRDIWAYNANIYGMDFHNAETDQ